MHILWLIIGFIPTIFANEFIVRRKPRKVSFNKIKQEAADLLSQQLRLSAQVVQQIGSVQVKLVTFQMKDTCVNECKQLKAIGSQLYVYSVQCSDLLHPLNVKSTVFSNEISLSLVLHHLVNIVGTIQTHIIRYLEDIFEGSKGLFVRKNVAQLPDVVKIIRLYKDQFYALKKTLHSLENKLLLFDNKSTESSLLISKKDAKKT